MKKNIYIKSNGLNFFSLFILLLLFVFPANSAIAHRVVVFAWIDGDTVFTESQFPDGRKIVDGRVNVFDMSDNLLLEGKTDRNGAFSFKIPGKTALNIVLDAGMGHQGQWKLSEKEIASAPGGGSPESIVENGGIRPDPVEASENISSSESLRSKDSLHTDGEAVRLNEKQLEQLIERILDKKLQPVNGTLSRILAGMQVKGPSVNDIFSGIGYILGLMGVAAYFLSKKTTLMTPEYEVINLAGFKL